MSNECATNSTSAKLPAKSSPFSVSGVSATPHTVDCLDDDIDWLELSDLSDELLQYVLFALEIKELCAAKSICSRWRTLVELVFERTLRNEPRMGGTLLLATINPSLLARMPPHITSPPLRTPILLSALPKFGCVAAADPYILILMPSDLELITFEKYTSDGLEVVSVHSTSIAGINVGDVVTAINGVAMSSVAATANTLRVLKHGNGHFRYVVSV